jgi:Ni,Fe-hydrogenase I large subunit
MIDLSECLDRFSRAATGEEADQAEPHGVAPAAREGFAAVETSRGRLGHWTRLSRDGKIEQTVWKRFAVSRSRLSVAGDGGFSRRR